MTNYLLGPCGYTGHFVVRLNEDGMVSVDKTTYTVDAYRKITGINYRIVGRDELYKEINRFEKSGHEPLMQISADWFIEYLECTPHLRTYTKDGVLFFFINDPEEKEKQRVVVLLESTCYSAIRSLQVTDEEILREIRLIPEVDPSRGYSIYTLEELLELDLEYFKLHRDNFGCSEFDFSINDISRAIILKYTEKYGTGYLGGLIYYDPKTPQDCKLVPYTGQKIYNSRYSFIVSEDDSELTQLIIEYKGFVNKSQRRSDITLMGLISDRINALKGINLTWV